MNSLSDVKISLEVSIIFASALGPVDNHAEFTIFTTSQGIDHFFCKPKTIGRLTIGKPYMTSWMIFICSHNILVLTLMGL